MYKHLLVPVDGTTLSSANVRSALQLAAALQSAVTFLHVTADFGATSDGALLHVLDPELFEQQSLGKTNVHLAKAVASARAQGVEARAVRCTSSRPAEAIVKVAASQGADLIVMASRGPRGIDGWLHSSQTERVLRNAPVALLVTRVAASDPLRAEERALGVIYDEHRSIAVTMNQLRRIASSEEPLAKPQREQVRMLVGYLRDFPQRLHHPKEEQYLHRLMRLRHPPSEALLAELEAQHQREKELIGDVQAALAACETEARDAEARLRSALVSLVQTIASHLGREETDVFLLAREHLQEGDWNEIATAFEANEDPRFGDLASEEFNRLFVRIANLSLGASESGSSR